MMKKFFLISMAFVLLTTISFAQIKVSTSGTVSVGSTTDATEALEVHGNTSIDGHTSINGNASINGDVEAISFDVGYNISVANRTTTDDIIVHDQAVFYEGLSAVGDVSVTGEVDANTITSPNFIYSGRGFKTSKTDYYTNEITLDINNMTFYPELVPTTYTVGYLGTSDHPWAYTHTQTLYLNGVNHVSDIRSKENIKVLDVNSLEIIEKLNPVKYDYKKKGDLPAELKDKYPNDEKLRKNRVGLLAQEVEQIYPEAVTYDSVADQYYIDYISFTPLLIKALQEQQNEIEELKTMLDQVINNSTSKKSLLQSYNPELQNNNRLFQNEPNPFSEETIIKFTINDTYNEAHIMIFDLTGNLLNKLPIYEYGNSSLNIDRSMLSEGMYIYSLIIDNQVIDSKQMVISK